MKEHCVTYDQAVKLKELGFDWKCDYKYCLELSKNPIHNFGLAYPNENLNAPRLDQAQAWLRDCKDTIVIAEPYWESEIEDYSDYFTSGWCFAVWQDGCYILCNFDPNKEDKELWLFDTYEEALSAGIDKALELLTDQPTAI